MNFFWKLFFSISISVLLCVGLGGTLLVQENFESALERERKMAGEECDFLYTALERATGRGMDSFYKAPEQGEQKERIKNTAASVSAQSEMGTVTFCLTDASGRILYTNSKDAFWAGIQEKLTAAERACKIYQSEGKYYLQYTRSLPIYQTVYYVKTTKDISTVFYEKDRQYRYFQFVTGIVAAVCFFISFVISRWLVKPIRRLSKAAKNIAGGEYGVQVPVKGTDEIAMLGGDFNEMSGRLKQYVEELEEKTRRQELFTSNFAHELKTPMTSMIGYADMIRSKKISEEQTVLYANQIVKEGKRLEKLSMKLMELVVLKKQSFTLRRMEAVDFLEEVSDTVAPVLEKAGIIFSMEAEAAVLNIEPDLMKTVCINLLDNARKAVKPGGHVSLRGVWKEDGYHIQVQDDGCGMEKEELDRVTEAFYMVDKSRTRACGGAGLGLAICQEIVSLHHGRLLIESEPGRGTRITVVLKEAENEESR